MTTPTYDPPTDAFPPAKHQGKPFVPRMIRLFAVPIVIAWVAVIAVLNVIVPQLETVGQMRAVSMSPADAPSMIAMKRVGQNFAEGESDSSAMIVLEGEQPLGDEAHAYYDELIKKLREDTEHVQSIQDFWSDPLTASGSQSNDGLSADGGVKLHTSETTGR